MTTGKEDKVDQFKKQELDAAVESRKITQANELDNYKKALQAHREEEWLRWIDKVNRKGVTYDSKGNEISLEQRLDNLLHDYDKQTINSTSDWRAALMAILAMLNELCEILSIYGDNSIINAAIYCENKVKEYEKAKETYLIDMDKFKRGEISEQPKPPEYPAKAVMLGDFILSTNKNIWTPLKGNILHAIRGGDVNDVLPLLQHHVDFKDGKVVIDPLTVKTGVPIADSLQKAFEVGVHAYLEQKGYTMKPDDGTFVKMEDPNKGAALTEEAFKRDIKPGLAEFFEQNAQLQYEERTGPTP